MSPTFFFSDISPNFLKSPHMSLIKKSRCGQSTWQRCGSHVVPASLSLSLSPPHSPSPPLARPSHPPSRLTLPPLPPSLPPSPASLSLPSPRPPVSPSLPSHPPSPPSLPVLVKRKHKDYLIRFHELPEISRSRPTRILEGLRNWRRGGLARW